MDEGVWNEVAAYVEKGEAAEAALKVARRENIMRVAAKASADFADCVRAELAADKVRYTRRDARCEVSIDMDEFAALLGIRHGLSRADAVECMHVIAPPSTLPDGGDRRRLLQWTAYTELLLTFEPDAPCDQLLVTPGYAVKRARTDGAQSEDEVDDADEADEADEESEAADAASANDVADE